MLSIYFGITLGLVLGGLWAGRRDRLAYRQIVKFNDFCQEHPRHIVSRWRNEEWACNQEESLRQKVRSNYLLTASYVVWPITFAVGLCALAYEKVVAWNDERSTDKHINIDLAGIREEIGRH